MSRPRALGILLLILAFAPAVAFAGPLNTLLTAVLVVLLVFAGLLIVRSKHPVGYLILLAFAAFYTWVLVAPAVR